MRALLLTAFAVLVGLGCRSEPLVPGDPEDGTALTVCEQSGGRCVARPTSGPNVGMTSCGADEIEFSSPPALCADIVEDCCIARCPEGRPKPNDACRTGASCQYREGQACIQAECLAGQWWLSVAACTP